MKLKNLLEPIEYSLTQGTPGDVTQITYDSRRALPGTLFVCLVGANTDGHKYAESAYQGGCRSFLSQRPLELPEDACVAVTADTRSALAKLAPVFYGEPAKQLKLIGITGTKGKTTTALLIQSILNGSGIPTGYIGSNGVHFAGNRFPTANTTPESLVLQGWFRKMADAGISHVVLEVSSQALEHNRVQGLRFDTAVFTNFSPDHVGPGEHDSLESYRAAKRRLFTDHACGAVVANLDDEATAFMVAGIRAPVLTFSARLPADFYAENLQLYRDKEALGIRFCLGKSQVTMRSPGAFSVYNGLAALAVCSRYGVPVEKAAQILAHTDVEGRFQVVAGKPGVTFIVDYAHNGLSLRSALEVLRQYAPSRLICLFGSVGGRTQGRRKELAEVASELADLCILTSDNPDREDPEAILQEILSHYDKTTPYILEPDREKAVLRACDIARAGDIVLLAGKGHEDYQLIDGEKVPFSEKQLIQSWAEAIPSPGERRPSVSEVG